MVCYNGIIPYFVVKGVVVMQLELRRVSPFSRIMAKINHEMDRPVCVVVCGWDSQRKEEFASEFIAKAKHISRRTDYECEHLMPGFLRFTSEGYLLVMGDEASYDPVQRTKIVAKFRYGGAQTVVGVYITGGNTKETRTFAPDAVEPSAKEFDYLLVVE